MNFALSSSTESRPIFFSNPYTGVAPTQIDFESLIPEEIYLVGEEPEEPTQLRPNFKTNFMTKITNVQNCINLTYPCSFLTCAFNATPFAQFAIFRLTPVML